MEPYDSGVRPTQTVSAVLLSCYFCAETKADKRREQVRGGREGERMGKRLQLSVSTPWNLRTSGSVCGVRKKRRRKGKLCQMWA